jgi:Tfp pilus assembly protein PilV
VTPRLAKDYTHRWSARASDERGMTILEVLVSVLVLTIGLLGVFGVLDGSNNSVVAGERSTVMTQVGQSALQAAEALPYADLADSTAPVQTSTTATTDPTYYLSGCSGGSCTTYQWNPTVASTVETIDIASTGRVAPLTTAVVAAPSGTCTTTSTTLCQMTLSVYTFVTETTDAVCSQSGVTCSSYSYKRVTVAVKNAGTGAPKNAIYLAAFVGNQVGTTADPLYGATSSTSPTTCLDGAAVVACVH